MEEALLQVGLPVKCAYGDCETTGFVKPLCVDPKRGGWYKSRMFRFRIGKRWFCPKHAKKAKEMEDKFYEKYRTPAPEPKAEDTVEELYKLLD